jgi:hypothetical protein
MFEDRVQRGAAFLDHVCPGWAWKIALDRLAMDTCDRCIVGQLFGNFYLGARCLLTKLPSTQEFSASAFGFTLHHAEQNTLEESKEVIMPRFAALADAWRKEVLARVPAGS